MLVPALILDAPYVQRAIAELVLLALLAGVLGSWIVLRRYGLTVVGTVIPALTTQAQASSGDLAKLVDTIRREKVKAIFAESSVNAKVEDAVAQETGARVGRALWADSLGPAGSDGATYADSIRANTAAIVEGLSGGAKSCTLPR